MTDLLEGRVMRPDEWTPDQAAAWVTEAWQGAVESIVETGRRLAEAKIRVGHGNWLPTVAQLPFNERTAQKLMEIARHQDISNASNWTHLPASWTTLHALAQLPVGEIPRRIESQEITAELDGPAAQQMAAVYNAARQEVLNAYSDAVDGATAALSWAKASEPPADIPEHYLALAEFKERISELNTIAENWST